MSTQSLCEVFGPEGFSYIMLKPDGNRREVEEYLRVKVEAADGFEMMSFPLIFTLESAARFYPKDEAWCSKYGKKRIDYLVGEFGDGYTGSRDPLVVGREILNQMAQYLSSGPCLVLVFACKNARRVASEIVGATVPKDAASDTLRGRFGLGDSIEVSAIEDRALYNVAHAPDPENVVSELQYFHDTPGVHALASGQVLTAIHQFLEPSRVLDELS